MADEALRDAERAWSAGPDPEVARRYAAALRRAGRPVPEEVLDARVLPPRTLRSRLPLDVSVVLPDGTDRHLGSTRGGRAIDVPAHRSLSALAERPLGPGLREVLAEDLAAAEVERLWLDVDLATDVDRIIRAVEGVGLTHVGIDASRAAHVRAPEQARAPAPRVGQVHRRAPRPAPGLQCAPPAHPGSRPRLPGGGRVLRPRSTRRSGDP